MTPPVVVPMTALDWWFDWLWAFLASIAFYLAAAFVAGFAGLCGYGLWALRAIEQPEPIRVSKRADLRIVRRQRTA